MAGPPCLLRANLALSPTERLRRHQVALDRMRRLQEALSDLHPVHRMTPGGKPLALTASNAVKFKNLYLDTDLGPIDCLSEIHRSPAQGGTPA